MKTFALLAAVLLLAMQPVFAQTDLSGFPISYTKTSSAPVLDRGPLVCDITGGPAPEILVVGNEGTNTTRNRIFVYDSSGTLLFTLSMPIALDTAGYTFSQIPAVADGDGDGNKEVVIGAWRERTFLHYCPNSGDCHHDYYSTCHHYYSYVLSWEIANGIVSEPTQQYVLNTKLTSPAVADVTGPDGVPDGLDDLIFVGADFYGPVWINQYQHGTAWGNSFLVFRWEDDNWVQAGGDGEGLCSHDNVPDYEYPVQETMPAVGDITGDGVPEIFVLLPEGSSDGFAKLKVYDPMQSQGLTVPMHTQVLTNWYPLNRNQYALDNPDATLPGPLLADMDRDGVLDVVFILRNANNSQDALYMIRTDNWSATQRLLPTNQFTTGRFLDAICQDPFSSSALGVFIPMTTSTSRIFEWFSSEGRVSLHGWPKSFTLNEASSNHGYAPCIANTDAASDLELVTQLGVSGDNRVRNLKLDNTSGNDFSWTIAGGFDANQQVLSAPTVADINQDGVADLVLANDTSTTQADIHAYNLGIPYSPETNQWNGFQNGPKHTGLYAQPVTGTQAQTNAVWFGRVTVHGGYFVGSGQQLTIQPGTVVELMPNAELTITGSLQAIGLEEDSIIFTELGGGHTAYILLGGASETNLQYCKIHGLDAVEMASVVAASVRNCRIYDMYIGLDVIDVAEDAGSVNHNTIENCSIYGIQGMLSSGSFDYNTIRHCTRAGIYWAGDRDDVEPPIFEQNLISENGVQGSQPMAGACFDASSARLGCNTFEYNFPYQILCENYADVVMNGDYVSMGGNTLHNTACNVACITCYPNCDTCAEPYTLPLLVIRDSWPHLNYGYNAFEWDNDGVYVSDPTLLCSNLTHAMTRNNYSPNSQPPGAGNSHFCPDTAFWGPQPNWAFAECEEELEELLMEGNGSESAYQAAARQEREGNLTAATTQYDAVIAEYPSSREAVWSTRSALRTALRAYHNPLARHDSLTVIWENAGIPQRTRAAARREAVWALVAGSSWSNARTELQGMIADPTAQRDSLWAEVMLAAVDFLETSPQGSGKQAGTADIARLRQRVTSFQDRVHQIMGRQTDQDVLNAKAPVAESKDLSLAYPNPFNSVVNIRFDLREDARTKLEIFNVLGRKVATLADANLKSGQHIYQWTADNAATGVYFYRLSAGTRIETRKVLLLR